MRFDVKLSIDDLKLDVNFENFQSVTTVTDVEYYEGSYTVTPKTKQQKLDTKHKYLVEDVVVKTIPYAEVTNIANGKTVTIGEV